MGIDVILMVEREGREIDVFEASVTHNLTSMAEAANIYMAVWRPNEVGIIFARELIEPLGKGIEMLRANPEYYKTFNPPNGWGTYDRFVPWLIRYLGACREYPDALIKVFR